MLIRTVLYLALFAVAGFGVWEVRRWSAPEFADLISPKQRRIRAWGLFFLLLVFGLWLGGTYQPLPHKGVTLADKKSQIAWLQYWMLTICASLPLIPLALLDWRENLRHLSESRKRLFQETIGPLVQTNDLPPTTPA